VKPARTSARMGLETVFHAEGSSTAEFEALTIKSFLEANGIAAIVVGDSVLPNMPFEVKVPSDQARWARKLISERPAPSQPS
jgi:hypothetical protein